MANLVKTMDVAARMPVATTPVVPRNPPIASGSATSTIAQRLEGLDAAQLRQIAQGVRGSWMLPEHDDPDALRQALVDYVDEWADDAAEEANGDVGRARAAAREEATGFIEEETVRVRSRGADRSSER